jgi:hypothetical protein
VDVKALRTRLDLVQPELAARSRAGQT